MAWDDVFGYAEYNGFIEIVRSVVAKGDVLAIVYHHDFYHGAPWSYSGKRHKNRHGSELRRALIICPLGTEVGREQGRTVKASYLAAMSEKELNQSPMITAKKSILSMARDAGKMQ